MPARDIAANGRDFTGNFAAWNSGLCDRNGQLPGFQPEVQVVEAAGPNANNDLAGGRNRLGNIAKLKSAGRAVSDKLHRFHAG